MWVRLGRSSLSGARDLNEDSVSIGFVPGRGIFAVVADGMGGHAAGEVASRIACDTLARALGSGAGLKEAVAAANREVWRSGQEHQDRKGMGTTTVAAWVRDDGQCYVANVGDSRAYRITGDGIEQITTDHSFVNDAVAQGKMTREEAERSKWRNALSRTIGSDEEVEVDVFGLRPVHEPFFLVLCSDGVTQTIDDGLLAAVVRQTPDVDEAAETLTRLAVARGSDDNASVAVLEFGEFEREPRDFTQPIATSLPEEAGLPEFTLDTGPEIPLEPSQRLFSWRQSVPIALVVVLLIALGLAIQRGVLEPEPESGGIEMPIQEDQAELVGDTSDIEDVTQQLDPDSDTTSDTIAPPAGDAAVDTLSPDGVLP